MQRFEINNKKESKLNDKLLSLESELEKMKFNEMNEKHNTENNDIAEKQENEINVENQEEEKDGIIKKETKKLNLKFPEMPNISQPPHLSASINSKDMTSWPAFSTVKHLLVA